MRGIPALMNIYEHANEKGAHDLLPSQLTSRNRWQITVV